MRITVLSQYARGVAQHDEGAGSRLLDDLQRIKWLLWHGNNYRVRDEIDSFEDQVDGLEIPYANLHKFITAAHEFVVYIAANADSLINYGERFRSGERISSAFGGGDGQRRGEQAVCQETADAVDPTRRAPAVADPHPDPRRDALAPVRTLVSGVSQRQSGRCPSRHGRVSAPHFLMLSLSSPSSRS